MADRYWVLKDCRLFDRMSPERIRQVESAARMKTFDKGDMVYLPTDAADGVLLLTAGRIRLTSITPEGKQAVLAFIEPGEFFGENAIADDGPREEYAEVVSASTVIYLPAETVREVMRQEPSLAIALTELIVTRRRRVERRLKAHLFRSHRDRLTHLLLELVEQYGRPDREGTLIGIPLSHQDLAGVIGSTRESVTLMLGTLQLEGLLHVGRQRIVVRDLCRLSALLGVAAPILP